MPLREPRDAREKLLRFDSAVLLLARDVPRGLRARTVRGARRHQWLQVRDASTGATKELQRTRIVPSTRDTLLMLAAATLLPVAPLLLTVIPAEELAKRLLQIVL